MDKNTLYFYAKRDLYYEIQIDTRNYALKFIYDYLCEHATFDGHIDLTELVEKVSIVYDGGNHPETCSNYASVVEEIFISNDQVYLNTEDTSFYELRMCSTDEILYIAELLAEYTIEIDNIVKGINKEKVS